MSKPITTIVTVADMIAPKDWWRLEAKSEVRYVEVENISEEELLTHVSESDYLMIDPDAVGFVIKESFYQKVKERKLPLKAISADITGMSWASPDAAKKHGMLLMNTADYSTVSVAEFTLALILVQLKQLNTVWLDRQSGKKEEPYLNDVLLGKTVGIVGLGNIGTKLAEMLKGFGVTIVGWDRNQKNLDNVKQLTIEQVMEQSDVLSIHLKTTSETKGMFGEKLLSHAKAGQYVINEADGPLVDNQAMLDAINSGKINGYACANAAVEGSPLQGHEKVVSFPSQAWYTEHSLELLRKIWVDNVLSAIDGKPQNIVD
ncbi:MAG: NAD(P)-dependent oxidoreductase [Candidatus Saccharibacteria bacterium]